MSIIGQYCVGVARDQEREREREREFNSVDAYCAMLVDGQYEITTHVFALCAAIKTVLDQMFMVLNVPIL